MMDISLMISFAYLNSFLITKNLGDSLTSLKQKYNRAAKGIKVSAKITLQLTIQIPRIATKICPKAHPIDNTMGVDALLSSSITSLSTRSDAL